MSDSLLIELLNQRISELAAKCARLQIENDQLKLKLGENA